MSESLLIERKGSTLVLTLNRPNQLNAMDSPLYERLIAALRAADNDDDVASVIIRGEGRAFCAGADTGEFKTLTPDRMDLVEHRANLSYQLHKTIPEMGKPVIAAVHGYAVGGGAGLAVACDIAVASQDTKLGYPEIKQGLVAAVVMANLTKQVGRKAAFELVSTGRLVDAAEAARIGLITRVVPVGAAYDEALATAELLSRNNASALVATKRLFQAVGDVPLHEGLKLGRSANEAMRAYRVEAPKT